MGENPRCPLCGRKLFYRKNAEGYVCKNWKDRVAYWKLGRGLVFDSEGNFKKAQDESSKDVIKDLLRYIENLE